MRTLPIILALLLTACSDQVRVEHVIDGDTFVTGGGTHVRLIGVNTPELNGAGHRAAIDAKEYVEDMIEGRTVRLEYDDKLKGPYGRTLAYVYVDNVFLNRILVERGYAEVSIYDNKKKAHVLRSAE